MIDLTAIETTRNRTNELARTFPPELALLPGAEQIRVTTDPELAAAVDYSASLRKTEKSIETERKAGIEPLKSVIDKINGWFKPSLEAIERTRQHVDGLISGYQLAKADRQRAAFVLAQTAVAAGDMGSATEALTIAGDAQPTRVAGLSVRERWRATVTSAAAVPREWLTVDVKALDQYARRKWPDGSGPAPIPGVVFVRDAVTTIRSGDRGR